MGMTIVLRLFPLPQDRVLMVPLAQRRASRTGCFVEPVAAAALDLSAVCLE